MSDPDDIRAWQRLSERITTSGRLQEGDPARLAEIGVKHVINLAMPDHPEALPDAAVRFADAGIAYTHIPVPFERRRKRITGPLPRLLEAMSRSTSTAS